jgi:hypothetical protein
VRAQVDRDLNTVGWVDRLLGLIKNLWRHKGAMCTRARPHGRAGQCGFGGQGVTNKNLGGHPVVKKV